MNEKPAYEQLITDKLNTLPVPDMADAIWARIEAQLDIDLPGGDGGGNSPAPQAPGGGSGLPGSVGVFFGIVVLVIFFFIYKNNPPNNESPTINLPATVTAPPDSAPPDKLPPEQEMSLPATLQNEKEKTPVLPAMPDSALVGTVTAPALDSAVVHNVPAAQPPLVTAAPEKKDTVASRKRRGVPLSDSDYRIVPKKDSLP